MNSQSLRLLSILVFSVLIASSCSTTKVTDDPNKHYSTDPYEGFNRSVYKFNRTADRYVLKPVATGYSKVVPKPAKKGVSNFFSNLGEPLNVVNNLLQGKFDGALKSTYRFTVNSTVGLLGLIDVAKHYHVNEQPEDFGQTLATWGVKPGPYLMLPFLGPSNLRDSIGMASSNLVYYPYATVSNSRATQLGLLALDKIDFRASLLSSDSLLEAQVDEYSFVKNAYEQIRVDKIYDGNPPKQEFDDFDDF